jgi:tetratricopeptide (TPR) repeat protein
LTIGCTQAKQDRPQSGLGLSLVCFSLSLSVALAFDLSAARPVHATKLNAKPLPHAGSVDGASGTSGDTNQWGRPNKDFSGQNEPQEVMPPSRWQSRKLDYRDAEKQQKAEAEAKVKAQSDAVKKAKDDQINAIKQYQEISIDANNKGVLFGKQGKWTDAIAQHELACKYDPGNKQFKINLSAARVAYAQKLLASKDYAAAANYFRRALVAAPDNAMAGKLLAQAVQRMGLDPGSVDDRLGIGDQLAAAGDMEGAYVEYQQAMLIDPSARTYTKMGDVDLRYGRAANASNWYRQAIVKNEGYGPAHRQLGMIMIMQKDNTGAASELRKAVIIDNKDVAAGQALIDIWRRQVAANPLLAENHLGLAAAMQLTGDYTTADNEYRQVEQLDPHNSSLVGARASLQRAVKHTAAEKHMSAAETFFNQGLARDALAEIGQAVMVEPQNSKYQFLLGQCLESNNDMQGAKQAYHTCIVIDPKNDEAAKRLREIENGGGGRPQPQMSQAPQGLSRDGGNYQQQQPQQQPQKNMYEGAPPGAQNYQQPQQMPQQQQQQQAREAQPVRQTASAGNTPPQTNQQISQQASQQGAQQIDPQTQATLTAADNLEVQHDFQGAANLLKQSLATNLQNGEIHHRLAVNLLNLGQLEEAVSEFRIASALNPSSKVFSEDYARAMKIHKKALSADNGGDLK